MSGRLSSPRFRRRLFWSTGTLGLLGVVSFAVVLIGNTGKKNPTKLSNEPAWVYKEPQSSALTAAERRELFAIATRFIRTAVARKHLDQAWEILGPEMRAGQTRKSWDTGNNNVVPFPAVGVAGWKILYSYEGDVAVDVAVIGAKTSDWAGKTFTIEFKHYPSHPRDWLVAYWAPKGVGGSRQIKSVAAQPVPPPPKAVLGAYWLLTPLVILGSLALGLAAWGVRTHFLTRRSAKRFAEALGYSSTSKPS
jgi:hypothetical protein